METLRSPREIDRLFREGKRSAGPLLVVLTAETPTGRGPTGRVLFVAGKKIGGAVSRNRAKRVLREAARRAGAPWRGHDVALIARKGAVSAGQAELDAAIRRALERAGIAT